MCILSQNLYFVLSKSLSELFSKLAFKIMPDEIPTGSEVNKYAYAHFYLLCQTMASRCSLDVPEMTVPHFEAEAVRNVLEMSQMPVAELENS